MSLDAYFIGVIQILVYAGAVMVLFLFIIMLLDIKAEEGKKLNLPAIVSGMLVAVLLVLQIITVVSSSKYREAKAPPTPHWPSPRPLASSDGQPRCPTITNDLEGRHAAGCQTDRLHAV
jgi:NADH-quinone oxidoreductase subunit J